MQANGEVIQARLARVREKINGALERSGREAEGVRLLVASKYYAPEQMAALAGAGVPLAPFAP